MASDQRRRDMKKLRSRLDTDDGFMSAHKIKKVRTRERNIPEWTLSDKEVRTVLLRSFPKLRTNNAQAIRAGRWVRLIHLYYRVQMSNSQVAKEMGMTLNATKMAFKIMRRVARGQRANNTGPLRRPPNM
jgi:hypothetical protein